MLVAEEGGALNKTHIKYAIVLFEFPFQSFALLLIWYL